MLRRLVSVTALVVVPLAGMLVPRAASAVTTTAGCANGVAVSEFAFSPSSVPLGSGAPLTLVLRNCTSQAVQGSTAWYGTYTGQACPVLDPIGFPYSIAPGGSYTRTNTYGDPGFPACQPTALTIHANVYVNGAGTATTATATLRFLPRA